MSIEKLEEFAKDGDKNLDNLDVSQGFLQSEKPERQWFNQLLNNLTRKTNEVIDYTDGVIDDVTAQKLDTGITATAKFGGVEREQADKNTDVISINDIYDAATTDYAEILTNIATVKKGAVLDLGGKTLPATALPDDIQLINGAIETDGKVVAQPLTAKAHPIAGNMGVILDDGITHFWCHEMLHDLSNGKTMLFVKHAYRHAASLSAPLYMYVSDDNGLTIKTTKVIYNVRGSDIAEVRGTIMSNGRYGLMLSMRDTANVYTNDFLYSDDKGVTWAVIKNVTATPNFVYSDMLQSPFNSNTFYVYGYLGGKQQVTKTTDNGLTWNNTAVDVGVGVTEPSVVKLPNQNKWLSFIRTATALYVSTSTDMENWTAAESTGIALNSNPVQVSIENGRLFVYLFIRDFSLTLASENSVLLLIDDYNYVYDNKSFSNKNLIPAFTGYDRQLGYMRIQKTALGNIFTINAGEYDGSTNAASSSSVIIGGNYMSSVPTPRAATPNYLRNGKFDFWSRGSSFTGAANFKCADGWWTNNSGSTMTVSQYTVPIDISQSLPFRPKYGMKIEATADDYIGFFQIDYSDTALQSTQSQILTVQIWGMGVVPELELSYMQFFGVGGSTSASNSNYKFDLSNVGTDKIWSGVARIPVPSIEDKSIGEGAYFRFTVQSRVNAAWDCVILGINAVRSTHVTPYTVAGYDRVHEYNRCKYYLEVLNLNSNEVVGMATSRTATDVESLLSYSPKMRIPTISATGSFFFYPSGAAVTSISGSVPSKNAAILVGTSATGTAGQNGFLRCANNATAQIIIDCE